MAISDAKYKRLTLENVDRAPRKRGVYALYEDKTLVFLGRAEGRSDTIRSRLRAHLLAPPAGATRYKREITAEPDVRLKALLAEHLASHGRVPTANAKKK